jgi:hypothetical protein
MPFSKQVERFNRAVVRGKTMGWKRIKEIESGIILGQWENTNPPSMITITKGLAHIVHKGVAMAFPTPEEMYSSNPSTVAKMIAKQMNLLDATQSEAWN